MGKGGRVVKASRQVTVPTQNSAEGSTDPKPAVTLLTLNPKNFQEWAKVVAQFLIAYLGRYGYKYANIILPEGSKLQEVTKPSQPRLINFQRKSEYQLTKEIYKDEMKIHMQGENKCLDQLSKLAPQLLGSISSESLMLMSRAQGFMPKDKILWDVTDILNRAKATHSQGPSEFQGVRSFDIARSVLDVFLRNPFNRVRDPSSLSSLNELFDRFTSNFTISITKILTETIKMQILHPSPDKPNLVNEIKAYSEEVAKINDNPAIKEKLDAADALEPPKLYLNDNFMLSTMCALLAKTNSALFGPIIEGLKNNALSKGGTSLIDSVDHFILVAMQPIKAHEDTKSKEAAAAVKANQSKTRGNQGKGRQHQGKGQRQNSDPNSQRTPECYFCSGNHKRNECELFKAAQEEARAVTKQKNKSQPQEGSQHQDGKAAGGNTDRVRKMLEASKKSDKVGTASVKINMGKLNRQPKPTNSPAGKDVFKAPKSTSVKAKVSSESESSDDDSDNQIITDPMFESDSETFDKDQKDSVFARSIKALSSTGFRSSITGRFMAPGRPIGLGKELWPFGKPDDQDWFITLDSGASSNVSPIQDHIHDPQELEEPINMESSNGTESKLTHIGSLLGLMDVLCGPKVSSTLLSFNLLWKEGTIESYPDAFIYRRNDGTTWTFHLIDKDSICNYLCQVTDADGEQIWPGPSDN